MQLAVKQENDDDETSIHIGQFVKQIRANRGYSQRELASMLEVSQAYVGQVELGQFKYPIEFCKSLARLLTRSEKQEMRDILVSSLIEELGV